MMAKAARVKRTPKPKPDKPARFVLPVPMSDADLLAFVMAWCDGWIVSSHHVPADILRNVFMPLALGGLAGATRKQLEAIGLVYAQHGKDRAVKMSINGWPIFASCSLMLATDWERAKVAIKAELDRRASVRV